MKKFFCAVFLFMFLCGCATTNGVDVLKKMKSDKGCKNTAVVEINKNLEDSKAIVRAVSKEMGLMEKDNQETPKFIYCEVNFSSAMRKEFSGQKMNYYGFFFEPDDMDTVTTVTIVENAVPNSKQKRDDIAARIKELAK